MNYKVIGVKRDVVGKPVSKGVTDYTLKRSEDGFTFVVRMWDTGMFSIRSTADKQIGYSNQLREEAMKAIDEYKFKQTLSPKTAETFGDIIDEL
jgi:hypothetical protein